jgi:hypothetical protein
MLLKFDFNEDPDPAFHFNADPDPALHSNVDPDRAFQTNADPCESGSATLFSYIRQILIQNYNSCNQIQTGQLREYYKGASLDA